MCQTRQVGPRSKSGVVNTVASCWSSGSCLSLMSRQRPRCRGKLLFECCSNSRGYGCQVCGITTIAARNNMRAGAKNRQRQLAEVSPGSAWMDQQCAPAIRAITQTPAVAGGHTLVRWTHRVRRHALVRGMAPQQLPRLLHAVRFNHHTHHTFLPLSRGAVLFHRYCTPYIFRRGRLLVREPSPHMVHISLALQDWGHRKALR